MAELDNLRSISLFAASRPRQVRPQLTSMGIFEATGKYVYRRHQHLAFELIVVISGRYRCRLNGEEVVLVRRQVLLVKPQDWHEDLLTRGVRYWAISFRLGDGSISGLSGWFRRGVRAQEQRCAPKVGAFFTLLARMRRESEAPDAVSVPMQDAMLGELVWHLARAFPREVLAKELFDMQQEDPFLQRLEQCFESRLQMPLTVGEMARSMTMSPTALGLRCRHSLGLAPAKAFARFKIERARELLLGTTMNVVEVSEHLGFDNQFHFSRVFRRHFSHPPSRLKRQHAP
jgi:AraC family transcriptional regulator of arabinose operon